MSVEVVQYYTRFLKHPVYLNNQQFGNVTIYLKKLTRSQKNIYVTSTIVTFFMWWVDIFHLQLINIVLKRLNRIFSIDK